MIPTHVLTDLASDEFVAILARKGEVHFYVHTALADADAIRAFAQDEGSEVVASHLRDHDAIRVTAPLS